MKRPQPGQVSDAVKRIPAPGARVCNPQRVALAVNTFPLRGEKAGAIEASGEQAGFEFRVLTPEASIQMECKRDEGRVLGINTRAAAAGGFPKRFYRAIVCDAVTGLRLGTITQLANGRVQFDLNGASARSYVIQACTNLIQWENIRTNVGVGGPIMFEEPATNHPRRIHRVREVP